MATSDRLYELCLDCRESESALERLRHEADALAARLRAAGELADAVEGAHWKMPAEVLERLQEFRLLQ